MAATKPAGAFVASCLLLAIALPGLAMATRVDPGTATLIRGGDGEGGGAASGRHLTDDGPGGAGVSISTIHWCWGRTGSYSGWCPGALWDGVSTGGPAKCTFINPNDKTCVPQNYLDTCGDGKPAMDYFLRQYGFSAETKVVCTSMVHAMCNCDWCAVATAAENMRPLLWGPASEANLQILWSCCS